MTTIASRIIRSTPHRDAVQTWNVIVELLTKSIQNEAYTEMMAVSGIASSIITDQYPKDAGIIVTCDGPRTRIYCLYNEDAIEGSDAKEDVLGFDPIKGNWQISLPCGTDDLTWVQNALKKQSTRITARDLADPKIDMKENPENKTQELVLDPKGFLGA